MAKNSVRDFDATAANNTDIQSVDIAENCAPSGINNAIRELMADIKDVSAGTVALESPQADSMTVTGDLTVDTNTLFVDSTNNRVGVGTVSPDKNLEIASSGDTTLRITDTRNTSYTAGDSKGSLEFYWEDGSGSFPAVASSINCFTADTFGSSGGLNFKTHNGTNLSTRMTLDQNGNVGIGTSSPSYPFELSGTTNPILAVTDTTTPVTTILRALDSSGYVGTQTSHPLLVLTGGTERMRIDSSGNLLVGKTDTTFSTAGAYITSGGILGVTRAGGELASFNRTGSDGTIMGFYKDGATVGSIGAASATTMYVSSSQAGGLRFTYVGSDPIIAPCTTTGANLDNSADLGFASARFDDIFATNTTIQTSDQNEKQQIASLTDAEITAAKAISKLFKTFKWNDSVEAKGDSARKHTGHIAQEVQQAMTDAGLNAADYAFWCSNTWWETQTDVPAVEAVEAQDAVYDDDGNIVTEAVEAVEAQDAYTRTDTYKTADEAPEGATERTRLGIRYPELLAFVGAATEQRLADIETRLTALEA